MTPLTKYVFRNLAGRPAITALVLGSMLLVGATIGAVAAVGTSMRAACASKRHDNWVIVTARAVRSESDSRLPSDLLGQVTVGPEIQRFSAEAVFVVPQRNTKTFGCDLFTLRAVDPIGFEMHGVEITQGRLPREGQMEFIVGDALLLNTPSLQVGSTMDTLGAKFTCVGVFHSEGFFAGEIWTTRAALRTDPRRISLSVVYLETASRADADALSARLNANKALTEIEAVGEPAFYQRMAGNYAHLIYAITLIFVLVVSGAIAAAANVLLLLQQQRLPELCALRAIGFRSRALAELIVYEIELLALIGGILGVALAAAVLHDQIVHANGQGLSPINFRVHVGWDLSAFAVVILFLLGLVGSIVPIVRMVRTPITRGLREE